MKDLQVLKQAGNKSLDDLRDLKVKASMLKSGQIKGRKVDESDQSIAQAAALLAKEFSQKAMSMSKLFDSFGMEIISQKYDKVDNLDLENINKILDELLKDIEEVEKRVQNAIKVQESRSEHEENFQKSADEVNKQAEAEHRKARESGLQKSSEQESFSKTPKTKDILQLSGVEFSTKGLFNSGSERITRVPSNILEEIRNSKGERGLNSKVKKNTNASKKTKGKSNLRFAKSSGAKEQEQQKALRKEEKQMAKSAPVMGRQMSR